MAFLTNMGVAGILCIFKVVPGGKAGKEVLASSRSVFLEKFSANNFALADAERNTSTISAPLSAGLITFSPSF